MAPTQMAPVTVPAVAEAVDETGLSAKQQSSMSPDFRNTSLEFFGRRPQHQLHLQFRTDVAMFERFGG